MLLFETEGGISIQDPAKVTVGHQIAGGHYILKSLKELSMGNWETKPLRYFAY